MAKEAIAAGKHVWYDKPAGDWDAFRSMVHTARERRLHIQLGYMLRYCTAFMQVSNWLREGLLGDLYAVRGHMSTSSSEASRGSNGYVGGIAFQLAPHMIDQAVWLFGARPQKVTSFLRNDATPNVPSHADNTLVVLEFDGQETGVDTGAYAHRSAKGMASIDIAHMEASPAARRFEVYGTRGSAIILEPFEPGTQIRLCLDGERRGYAKGAQLIDVEPAPRSITFPREVAGFLATMRGERPADRSLDHELIVEETIHRASGTLPG